MSQIIYPHLAKLSPEFISLADVECIASGKDRIPLHSHVLAKSSKVFAQLFSTISEDGDGLGSPKKPMSVSDLFAGESLDTIVVTCFLLYNPDFYTIRSVLRDHKWGRRNDVAYPEVTLNGAVLRSVIRLLDKFDAGQILEVIDSDTSDHSWFEEDLLGWFLELTDIRLETAASHALYAMIRTLCPMQKTSSGFTLTVREKQDNAAGAAKLLGDPRWTQLPPETFLRIMDAMTTFQLKGIGNSRTNPFLPPKSSSGPCWNAPGDYLRNSFLNNPMAAVGAMVGANGGAPAHNALVAAEDLQMLELMNEIQAAADFNEQWDHVTDDEEEEEEGAQGGGGGNQNGLPPLVDAEGNIE